MNKDFRHPDMPNLQFKYDDVERKEEDTLIVVKDNVVYRQVKKIPSSNLQVSEEGKIRLDTSEFEELEDYFVSENMEKELNDRETSAYGEFILPTNEVEEKYEQSESVSEQTSSAYGRTTEEIGCKTVKVKEDEKENSWDQDLECLICLQVKPRSVQTKCCRKIVCKDCKPKITICPLRCSTRISYSPLNEDLQDQIINRYIEIKIKIEVKEKLKSIGLKLLDISQDMSSDI